MGSGDLPIGNVDSRGHEILSSVSACATPGPGRCFLATGQCESAELTILI